MGRSLAATWRDYRHSHLDKGADYDDAIASSPFDAYLDQHERRVLLEFVHRRFPTGIARYIDFACGTGRIMSAVAPGAKESVGIDVSASMLDEARRKHPGWRLIEADITRQTIDLEPAHLVTAFRFFGNAQPALRVAALHALRPLVRPDGYLVLNNHRNPLSLHNALLRAIGVHCLDLTYGQLARELAGSGFEIVESHPIGLWVVLNRIHRRAVFAGTAGARPERLVSFPGAPRIAPDAVIVARPRKS